METTNDPFSPTKDESADENSDLVRLKRQRKTILKNELKKGPIDINILKEMWPQCCHYIAEKRRMCNVARSAGELILILWEYCNF